MNELSYSLHLSSDKNRKPSSKNMAKNNASGSTSLSNNAIQNAKQLSRVDKHNYRKYDNNSELIEIIKGTTSLYEDVKNLYLEEFEEARLEYNKEQENKGRNALFGGIDKMKFKMQVVPGDRLKLEVKIIKKDKRK